MIPTPPLTAFRHGPHRMNAAMSRHDRLHPVGNRATHPRGLRRGRARAAWCLLAMLLVAAPVVVPGAATAQGLPQPGSRGQMLYLAEPDRLTVTWQRAADALGQGEYTFQALLASDGTLTFQYQTLTGDRVDHATVGIPAIDVR